MIIVAPNNHDAQHFGQEKAIKMKLYSRAAFLCLALTKSLGSCQNFLNQSTPFSLVVLSNTNATLNGSSLTSCHTGAEIESLCLYAETDATYKSFTLNYTSDPTTGVLTYLLPGPPGGVSFSEPVEFKL